MEMACAAANYDDHENGHVPSMSVTPGVDARLKITDAVNNSAWSTRLETGFVRNQIVEA